MHTKYGVREAVEKLSGDSLAKFLEFRLNFLEEELEEGRLAAAELKHPNASTESKHVAADGVVDAMIDLMVVALGTLDAFQVDAQLAWDRVQVANMQKEVGIKPSRPNPLGLPDLIKPQGWTAPSHMDNVGILTSISA